MELDLVKQKGRKKKNWHIENTSLSLYYSSMENHKVASPATILPL